MKQTLRAVLLFFALLYLGSAQSQVSEVDRLSDTSFSATAADKAHAFKPFASASAEPKAAINSSGAIFYPSTIIERNWYLAGTPYGNMWVGLDLSLNAEINGVRTTLVTAAQVAAFGVQMPVTTNFLALDSQKRAYIGGVTSASDKVANNIFVKDASGLKPLLIPGQSIPGTGLSFSFARRISAMQEEALVTGFTTDSRPAFFKTNDGGKSWKVYDHRDMGIGEINNFACNTGGNIYFSLLDASNTQFLRRIAPDGTLQIPFPPPAGRTLTGMLCLEKGVELVYGVNGNFQYLFLPNGSNAPQVLLAGATNIGGVPFSSNNGIGVIDASQPFYLSTNTNYVVKVVNGSGSVIKTPLDFPFGREGFMEMGQGGRPLYGMIAFDGTKTAYSIYQPSLTSDSLTVPARGVGKVPANDLPPSGGTLVCGSLKPITVNQDGSFNAPSDLTSGGCNFQVEGSSLGTVNVTIGPAAPSISFLTQIYQGSTLVADTIFAPRSLFTIRGANLL